VDNKRGYWPLASVHPQIPKPQHGLVLRHRRRMGLRHRRNQQRHPGFPGNRPDRRQEKSLSFKEWASVEPLASYDRTRVQASANGNSWASIFESHGTSGSWAGRSLDLSAYAGGDVYLRFWFDTRDSPLQLLRGLVHRRRDSSHRPAGVGTSAGHRGTGAAQRAGCYPWRRKSGSGLGR